jgi:hypothetical protein
MDRYGFHCHENGSFFINYIPSYLCPRPPDSIFPTHQDTVGLWVHPASSYCSTATASTGMPTQLQAKPTLSRGLFLVQSSECSSTKQFFSQSPIVPTSSATTTICNQKKVPMSNLMFQASAEAHLGSGGTNPVCTVSLKPNALMNEPASDDHSDNMLQIPSP